MLIDLGPLNKDEIKIAFIFSLAVIAWMTSRLIREYFGIGLEDAGVAIIISILLFVIPSSINKKEDLMQWDKTSKLPWGLLILFGGGLSLAAQVSNSGLGLWIGQGLTVLKLVHPIILIFAIATTVSYTHLTLPTTD